MGQRFALRQPFQQRFLEAARETGLPLNDDFNGAEQEGVGAYQVTQKHGERYSAARAYLLPHIGVRDNLSVETRAQVQRILFEGTRAVGVEVLQHGQVYVLRARREVILAAGAFQTPQLLMLSGVGPKVELQRHGIPLLHELPGVGQNLQDHPGFCLRLQNKQPRRHGRFPGRLPENIEGDLEISPRASRHAHL